MCTAPITPPAQAHMGHNFPTGEWIQQLRDYEAERNRISIDEMLNNSLLELQWEENGTHDTTEQKELL